MQINFTALDSTPTIDFDLGTPVLQEAKRPDLKREKVRGEYCFTRNGIRVTNPDTVRWVWMRFSDERPDLQGEKVDAATFRMCADASVHKWGGWIDINHWSRPSMFPRRLAEAGRSPSEYVIGKLTEIRVTPGNVSFAEGFLLPSVHDTPEEHRTLNHAHADEASCWLREMPDLVHCSAGGPLAKGAPEEINGEFVTPVKIFLNHIALCPQGVKTGTIVERTPFGAFKMGDAKEAMKAVQYGVPIEPDCDGDSCFPCYVRDDMSASEAMKAVGDNAPSRLDFANGPTGCLHLIAGRFPTDAAAIEHMTDCFGWSAFKAVNYLTAARR